MLKQECKHTLTGHSDRVESAYYNNKGHGRSASLDITVWAWNAAP